MIIEYSSELYPERLKNIKKPPSRLYVEGNVKLLNEVGIAVVGSRTNTQYGEKMCKKFTKDLVMYGLNIISGLAKGIDKIAHETCLKSCGKTIAVLPSGFKNIYPKENIQLFNKILENGGTVVSEYEEDTKPDSKKFIERNRIVAGLGIGTLVVEAGERSGTSITARLTKSNNKPVFCIPSNLDNIKGKTTNKLIKEGAYLVTEIGDILNAFPDMKFSKKIKEIKNMYIDIPEELLNVYKVIDNVPRNLNEISKKSGLPIEEVIYKTMMLEIEDKICGISGQRFIRKEDENN